MNTIQVLLAQYVAWCWHHGTPVKVALPKSRQLGSSTFWQLLFFALCELKAGYRVAVVAHDDEGAAEVFSRSRTCLRQLRARGEWPEPTLVSDQGGHMLWESESSMRIGTIKTGDALGKGGSPSAIHFSESANFSDKGINAKRAVNAIVNARADNRWTIEVHESTAKGKDPFYYPLCMDAMDPLSGSDYQLIFLPWFLEKGYSKTWEEYRADLVLKGKQDPGEAFVPQKDEAALREMLSRVEVAPGEGLYRHRVDLTDEQLVWRRWAIVNKCGGNLEEFQCYYPATVEEAFTTTANSMFEAETVSWYREHAQPPRLTAFLEETTIHVPALVPGKNGPLSIWKDPRPGVEYVVGADPGGEKQGSDPCVAVVMVRDTIEVVAVLAGHFEWDAFSDQLYMLGVFYNHAHLVVENNHLPSVVVQLHRQSYPNLCYHTDPDKPARPGADPGFNTNRKTRKPLIAKLRRATREKLLTNPDPEFYREMETFVWIPKAGSDNPDREGMFRATGRNHDDRIMAAGLALVVCDLPDPELMNQTAPEFEPSRAYRLFLELQREAGGNVKYLDLGPRRA